MGRTSEERVLTKQKEHFEERMNEVNERKREDGEQLVKRKVQRINKEEMKAAKKKYGD